MREGICIQHNPGQDPKAMYPELTPLKDPLMGRSFHTSLNLSQELVSFQSCKAETHTGLLMQIINKD